MNILLAIVAVSAAHSNPGIGDYVQRNLNDATFVAHVVKSSRLELKKINDSFAQSYQFDKTTVHYKDPLKLRLDAAVEDSSVLYILNGPKLSIKIPGINVMTNQDLSNQPGRRQTSLDFGILVPSIFENFFSAEFVRMDRATGCPVFDVTYQNKVDTSRSRIWIDPSRHIVTKREWYNQTGRQLATFIYDEPKQIDGVWVPTRLTVKNMDDAVAGVTQYTLIKINTGLADGLFTAAR